MKLPAVAGLRVRGTLTELPGAVAANAHRCRNHAASGLAQATTTLGLNLDYQYTGSQLLYVSAAEPYVESGAFHQLNLGARYRATRELSLKAGMNNLMNEKRDDVARSIDNILMGRTLFVGFSYDI